MRISSGTSRFHSFCWVRTTALTVAGSGWRVSTNPSGRETETGRFLISRSSTGLLSRLAAAQIAIARNSDTSIQPRFRARNWIKEFSRMVKQANQLPGSRATHHAARRPEPWSPPWRRRSISSRARANSEDHGHAVSDCGRALV